MIFHPAGIPFVAFCLLLLVVVRRAIKQTSERMW